MTHLVYSHHHADHAGAANLFGDDVVRIGHIETRRPLLRDNDPTRPAPEVIFEDQYTLEVDGERVELAWHGPGHSPDNIFIHFPDHDTLMVIDIVNAGRVPVYNVNLSEDVPGYIDAGDRIESYAWNHFISGHLGRLATRQDVTVHRQYIADIVDSSNAALASVDPTQQDLARPATALAEPAIVEREHGEAGVVEPLRERVSGRFLGHREPTCHDHTGPVGSGVVPRRAFGVAAGETYFLPLYRLLHGDLPLSHHDDLSPRAVPMAYALRPSMS